MTWFKFLAPGAVGLFSDRTWPAPPGGGRPGGWMAAVRLEPCRMGLHLCRPEDLPFWLGEELYTVEVDGDVETHESFVLARRARLLDRVDAWNQELAAAFCVDCASRVRELAVTVLRDSGHRQEADLLATCATTGEIASVADRLSRKDSGRPTSMVGYALDAAHFADAARTQPRWAAGTATTAFVAAKAAGVATNGSADRRTVAAERRHQGAWLAAHLPSAS